MFVSPGSDEKHDVGRRLWEPRRETGWDPADIRAHTG